MSWIFYALIGPVLWTIVNYGDKFFLGNFFKGKYPGSMVLFTSVAGFFVSLFILITHPSAIFEINWFYRYVMLLNGGLFVVAYIPYCHAIIKDDVSIVAPIFQTIPLFLYILGSIFLHESLSPMQMFAGVLIIFSSVLFSLSYVEGKVKLHKSVFWLMMLSSFMISLTLFIFKVVGLEEGFWKTGFWEYLGTLIFGLLLFIIIPGYRKDFIDTLKGNKIWIVGFTTGMEFLSIIAKLASSFASLLAPLALVMIVNGVQPFLLFGLGIIITIFVPSFGKENISKKSLWKKVIASTIMFIGIYLLFTN